MAKNIVWDYLKHYSDCVPGKKYNESELKVDFPNGGRFQLFGADNPDALRGMYFDYVILDEYSLMPSNTFSEIIRPSLSDRPGGAMFIGTFKSKRDQLYKLYSDLKGENTFRGIYPVSDTKALPQEELDDARRLMDKDEYLQEYECIPMDFVRGSYFGSEVRLAKAEGRIRHVPYERILPVHTVWDLGISDDTAIGFFQTTGGQIRMIDFYSNSGYGLDHYLEILRKKPYIYGKHIAPHDIEVRELSSGKSRRELAAKLGINFHIAPNLGVKEGIDAGRMLLQRMWISEENCGYFIDACAQYRREWNEKRGIFNDNPLHDWTSHAADVLRYAAVSESMFQYVPRRAVIHRRKTRIGSTGY